MLRGGSLPMSGYVWYRSIGRALGFGVAFESISGLRMLAGSSTKDETPLIDDDESEAVDVKEEEEECRLSEAACPAKVALKLSIRAARESIESWEFSREPPTEELRPDCDQY